MMDCTNYLEMIQRELDGELSELEEKRLKKHISQCPSCAEEYQGFQQVASLFADIELEEPPVALKGSVMAQIMQMDLGVNTVTALDTSDTSDIVDSKHLAELHDEGIELEKEGKVASKPIGLLVAAAIANALLFTYWMSYLFGLGAKLHQLLVLYQIMTRSFARFVVIGQHTGEALQVVFKSLALLVPWEFVIIYLTLSGVLMISIWMFYRRRGGGLT